MKRREFVKAIVALPLSSTVLRAEQNTSHKTPVIAVPPSPEPQAEPAGSALGGHSAASAAQETGAAPVESAATGLYRRQFLMVSGVADQFAETQSNFFSETQQSALRRLCELLMPPLQGHPGAIEAGVPEFLDFLISVSPADRQELYRTGLDTLNADANKRFGIPFEKTNAEQADAVVRPWLRVWTPHFPPAEPQARFIAEAHDDIRQATVNSHDWNVAAAALGDHVPGIGLYWSPIDPDYPNAYTKGEAKDRGRGNC
jgi:hypothetical protein